MARVEIPFSVVNSSNALVAGASIQVNTRAGTSSTVYAAETGGATLPNPLTSDSLGRIEGWVDEGSYNLVISGAGLTTYTQRFEANRGDGVSLIAANAVGTAAIANTSVTFAKLAADVRTNLIPAGILWPFAGTTAPAGTVLCDGATYNGTNATYTRLWSAIGTTHGGTGQSAFKVPDYRGKAIVGAGQDTTRSLTNRVLGAYFGNENEILSLAHLPSHNHGPGSLTTDNPGNHGHPVSDPGHRHNFDNQNTPAAILPGNYPRDFDQPGGYSGGNAWNVDWMAVAWTGISIQGGGSHSHTVNGGVTGNAGSGTGHPNSQPSLPANILITL